MKKIVLCMCAVVFTMFFSGCAKKDVQYGFLHEQSEISKIEIVMLGEMDEQGVNAQEVRCSVVDIELFMKEFSNVTCYERFSQPIGVSPEQLVVKITYNNGEYELIGRTGQARYTIQYQYVNRIGYYYFDEQEFYDLIKYYLRTADTP